jgi:hypothetical protein
MYTKFQAGLPEYEPPMMYSLAMLEDGTTEDSKYPNMMLDEVREWYGL